MRTTECLIDIDLTYPMAKQIATVSTNDELFSNCRLKCINDSKEFRKIASCEPNLFSLDGTYAYFPEDPTDFDTGYWSSSLSGDEGEFDTDVFLQFDLSKQITTAAITLYFGDTVAKDFTVEWLNDNTRIAISEVKDNSLITCIIEKIVKNYNALKITFTKAEPYRYIKLNEIDFGKILSTGNKEIMLKSAKMNECTDLLCNKIGIGTLDFELINKELMFYMLNSNEYYSALQENQKILCSVAVEENKVRTVYPMGTYYLSQWDNSNGSTAKFEAVNIIGKLEEMRCVGDFDYLNSQDSTVAADFFDAVFFCAGIDENDYIFDDDDIKNQPLTGFFPECSIREALQLLCIATQSTLRVSRDGKIHIFKPDFTKSPTEIGVIGTEKIKITQGGNVTGKVTKDNPFINGSPEDIENHWNQFLKNKCVEIEMKTILDFQLDLSSIINPISDVESSSSIRDIYYGITEIETDLTGGCIARIKGVGEIVANT